MPDRRHWWAAGPYIVLGAFALLTYVNVFANEWTYYDDYALARERYRVTAWSVENLSKIWTPQGNYVPLRDTLYLLDAVFFGPGIWGYQATNLALHVVGLWAFYALVKRQWGDRTVAFVAALLFAAHPLHVEAVAWVTGSKDLMCFAFCCLATVYYLRVRDQDRPRLSAVLAGVWVLLALASKLAALGLPLVFAAAEVCDPRAHATPWRRRLRRWLPYALLTGVWFLVAVTPARERVADALGIAGDAARTAPRVIGLMADAERQEFYWPALRAMVLVTWRYVGLWVWPAGLTAVYTVQLEPSWLRPPVFVGGLGLAAACAGGVWLWRRGWRRSVFWLAWAVAFYLPVSNIMPVVALMNDRYVHIPTAGGAVLLGATLVALARRGGMRGRLARVAMIGLVAVLAVKTVAQVTVWRSARTLWEHAASTQPDNVRVRITRAGLPLLEGQPAVAVRMLSALEDAAPDNYRRLMLLAQAYSAVGRYGPAALTLRHALEVYPNDQALMATYASVLARQGQFAAALNTANATLRIAPAYVPAHLVRAFASARLGRGDEAAEACATAVRLAPASAEIRTVAARALLEGPDPGAAVPYALAGYRMAPGAEAGLVYARALVATGDGGNLLQALLEELHDKWPDSMVLQEFTKERRRQS